MFAQVFAKKTVAGVLGVFNKAIEELKQVEEEQCAEAVRSAQDVVDAQARHDAAIKEAAMAREVQAHLVRVIQPVIPALGFDAQEIKEVCGGL